MKVLQGAIISLKMNDTAIVEVTRHQPHPLYKKLLKRTKRYKVDIKGATVKLGDAVKIVETRPMAKDKCFKLLVK